MRCQISQARYARAVSRRTRIRAKQVLVTLPRRTIGRDSAQGRIDALVGRRRPAPTTANTAALQREHDELLGRLQLQYERIPVACITSDAQFRIIDWNLAAERVFGYRRKEVLGQDGFQLLITPAGRAEVARIIRRLVNGDVSAHTINDSITKDGRVIVCEWHHTSLCDSGGNVVAVVAVAQDITERRRVEEKLLERAADLAEAQRVAKIGNWNHDLRANKIYWSEELYRIFEVDKTKFDPCFESFVSCIHPDDQEAVRLESAQARTAGSPFDIEYRIITPNGRLKIVREVGYAAQDQQGNIVRLFGTAQDITERARAEERLKRSESLLAEAQELAHIGSWNLDLRSGAIEWSDEHYRIFRRKPRDSRISSDQAWNQIHPDDRARVQDLFAQAIRDRRPFECSFRLLFEDGTIKFLLSRGQPSIDERGKPVRMFGTIQDVTDRARNESALRESEERVRLLLESTAEAIYGVDTAGKCTFSNPACLRVLGYRDPSDLLGKSMHELIHHTRRDGMPYPKEACRMERAFLRDEEIHADDEVLWRADGTSFPVEYWSHPVRRDGQTVGAVITFLDITDRKRLEAEILEVSERERRRIGQDLHDDLCQQLTGIAFTSRLLQQRLAARSDPEARMAEKIVQAVQHATGRTRDLAKGLHPVRLEADGLVAALRDLAKTLGSLFKISCRFRCRARRDRVHIADPAVAIQLYRIAQESVTNAVKHGKAKEICISIGAVKGQIKLTIADDGVGIVGTPRGQGMGLTVMRQRAHMIGAALTISKRRHRGTLVTCRVRGGPAARTHHADQTPGGRRRSPV